jgi:hypothetical protein
MLGLSAPVGAEKCQFFVLARGYSKSWTLIFSKARCLFRLSLQATYIAIQTIASFVIASRRVERAELFQLCEAIQ